MQRGEGGGGRGHQEGGKERGREVSGASGGVGENGPRRLLERARVWTDGSPAWEPCSSSEKQRGAEREKEKEENEEE